jgi:hypothetical protein
MNSIRTQIVNNLTGSASSNYQVYQDLSNGITSSYVALGSPLTNGSQHAIVTMLAYELFRANIDQDHIGGIKAATALSNIAPITYADITAANSLDWRNVNNTYLNYNAFAQAYDWGYNYMSPSQQAACRQAIQAGIANQWSIGMDALNSMGPNISNWISNNLNYVIVNSAVVEGEAGTDPFILPRARAALDRQAAFMYGPNGAYYEGMGKGQMDIEQYIIMAKRGHMNAAITNVKNFDKEFLLHSLMPWGGGFTSDELEGGDDFGFKMADVPGMKWIFPTDTNIDFLYRADYECSYTSSSSTNCWGAGGGAEINTNFAYYKLGPLVRAITALDYNTSETFAQAASALNGVEPNYYFDNMRGLAIFRDQWGANATKLTFQPRSEPGGHSEPDRNHIAFYALGRPWIPFLPNDGADTPPSGWSWPATTAASASTLHIDGYAVSTLPARVADLNTANSLYSYATGDATLAYNYSKDTATTGTTLLTWTYGGMQLTSCTQPYCSVPNWQIPDWQFSNYDVNGSTPANGSQYEVVNFPSSAVQYAFRTAGLVRGSDPFAVVTDDVKIDGKSHNYVFRLMTMPDLGITYPAANEALLTDAATGNEVLIAVLNSSATVTMGPNSFLNGIFDGAYSASSWTDVPSLDFTFSSSANPASIRVIIMAVAAGSSLPTISYSNNVATVTTSDGVTSTVTFATQSDGHETFSATQSTSGGGSKVGSGFGGGVPGVIKRIEMGNLPGQDKH